MVVGIPYKTREGGATVTVFVPYDCGNHCPFCINKQEYANPEGFSLEKICESIAVMDSVTPNCDFVFTGGEPFADPAALQTMLDRVPPTHKVFLNTTLPVLRSVTADGIVAFLKRNRGKITCVNVSRHLVKYVQECDDEIFARIPVPIRINCVLYGNYTVEQIVGQIRRFQKFRIPIQFRFDYTSTTPENLYDEDNDRILTDLKSLCRYVGMQGCRMRCSYQFEFEGLPVAYHKTLPYSTIRESYGGRTYDILYDILIKQTGEIHADWDGTRLDVEAYRRVRYEPYDLRSAIAV